MVPLTICVFLFATVSLSAPAVFLQPISHILFEAVGRSSVVVFHL